MDTHDADHKDHDPMPRQQTKELKLIHPPEISPEDFLRFFQMEGFIDDWTRLGLNDENDLWTLEIILMVEPEGGEVIPGTNGLRKMRLANKKQRSGKRGGIRVCYVYFPEHWTLLLVAAYTKNQKQDLTTEDKKIIGNYIRRAEAWLAQHNY